MQHFFHLTPLISFLSAFLIRLFRWTWRVQVHYAASIDERRPVVFCFWHGHQAALFGFRWPHQVAILSSLSKDGELQAGILARLGFVVCRGSSSRGAATGLRSMISKLTSGCDAAFAVDGPKGPIYEAKPGALKAADQSGAWVVPIHGIANRNYVFSKSWDRYHLPKPFAKISISVGAPLSPTALTPAGLTAAIDALRSA